MINPDSTACPQFEDTIRPKLHKLVAKATEPDESKRLYNAAMVQKVLSLAEKANQVGKAAPRSCAIQFILQAKLRQRRGHIHFSF